MCCSFKSVCSFLLMLFLSAPLLAQQPPAPQEEPTISELDWMVGEWQAVEKPDKGAELLVHLSARKSENQQAILFHVWFESQGKVVPKYDGMYYWHPGRKTFMLLQVNNDGNVAEGTYEQKGNRAHQMVKTSAKNGEFELQSDWEIRPREFHFVGQFRGGDTKEWVPAADVTYQRVEQKK